MHREMLGLQLERLQLIDRQIEKLNGLIAQAMKPHQEAVIRLAEVPGLGVDSAQQVISEVGVQASTFPSAAELTSWVGTCPGKDESAEENHSSRSAKGNKYLRRVLNQSAHAAVKKKGSHFQAVFRRLLPRLGYKSAIWAIAHRLCRVIWKILHEGVRYIEQGSESDPKVRERRARTLARALRKLGYDVAITHKPGYGPEGNANLAGYDFRRSLLVGFSTTNSTRAWEPTLSSSQFHKRPGPEFRLQRPVLFHHLRPNDRIIPAP